MGLFPSSNGHQYILVIIDYVSKWVEVVALPTNDTKVVVRFVKKNIVTRFETLFALISDEGASPYKLVYGKACHLHVELEHKAYCVIRKLNFNMDLDGEKHMFQLNELEEFRLHAYEKAKLTLFSEKLKSRWSSPFEVVRVTKHEAIELMDLESDATFLVNGKRVKHYWGGGIRRPKTLIDLVDA
nr:uncharacterized protein LOC117280255 [Nicotiana tomentosiformis]